MSKREEQSGLVLLIEDNRAISETVGEFLERRGYSVDYAADGVSGLRLATSNSYDVIVLDLMLPGMDGLDVCRRLRQEAKKSTPVLMLTARDTLEDKVTGLDAGADDYLVKPFSVGELLARIRVALRHRGTTLAAAITEHTLDDLHVDLTTRLVQRAGVTVHLTPTEFNLLARLVRSAGRVVTHRQLLTDVWGPEYTEHTHYLRLYMGQLRAKIERNPAEPRHLLTETGVGYRLAIV